MYLAFSNMSNWKIIKIVIIGDKPYKNSHDIIDSLETKNTDPPELLKLKCICENLEKTVICFKRPFNNQLDR